MYFSTLPELIGFYSDEEWKHIKILNHFYVNTDNDDLLKSHRDQVEYMQLGFGDREFSWLWKLLVDIMPQSFKALEIGVYKGQVISLWSLLAERENKDAQIFGITPLSGIQDEICAAHEDLNYYQEIKNTFNVFNLDFNQLTIIKGLSQDKYIIEEAKKYSEYDIIYIDGNHSYQGVVDDLNNYCSMLKIGGYLVCDDSSNYTTLPYYRFKGIETVSRACRDILYNNDQFKHLASVGHNNIFLRLK